MAAPFITVDKTAPNTATHAQRIIQAQSLAKQLREAVDQLVAESFNMLDGDGSSDAHYTLNTEKYGASTNAKAHELFDMFNGLKTALDNPSSQAVALTTRVG